MKKLFYLVAILFSLKSFAQGTLYIFNYSSYDLTGRLFAAHKTNCLPEVFNSYDVPAGAIVKITSFNDGPLANPPISGWAVRLSTTSPPMSQTAPSGLLTTLSGLTRWHFYWFQTRYAGTYNSTPDTDVTMGEAFPVGCNLVPLTGYIHNVVTDAKWYYEPSTNETTLIINDI